MKTAINIYMIIGTCMIFTACEKNSESSGTEENNHSIIGSWELSETSGGIIPAAIHAPGNGNRFYFDSTSYRFFVNGQLVQDGNYYVTLDSVVDMNSCELKASPAMIPNRIIFDQDLSLRTNFEWIGGKLKIMSGCIPLDGGSSIYRRIEAD